MNKSGISGSSEYGIIGSATCDSGDIFRNNYTSETTLLETDEFTNATTANNEQGQNKSTQIKCVDEANNNYDVTASDSVLVDNGYSNAVSEDYAGTIRPHDSGHDVGAYEYDDGAAPPGGLVTVTPSVAANDDDGYKLETDGTWASESFDALQIGYGGGTPQHRSGHLRFQLNVPQAATITAATITVKSASDNSDGAIYTVSAEDVDNSAQINNVGEYNTAVAQLTTANTSWDFPSSAGAGESVTSGSLVSIVQEVVDRGSWAANNYIQFFLVSSTSSAIFDVQAYENGSDYAQLSVTYNSAANPQVDSYTCATSGTVSTAGTEISVDLECSTNPVVTQNPSGIPLIATNIVTTDGLTRYWEYTSNDTDSMTGVITLQAGNRTPSGSDLAFTGDPTELLVVNCSVKNNDGDNFSVDLPAWASSITVAVPSTFTVSSINTPGSYDHWVPGDTLYMTSTEAIDTAVAGASGSPITVYINSDLGSAITDNWTIDEDYWTLKGCRRKYTGTITDTGTGTSVTGFSAHSTGTLPSGAATWIPLPLMD
jgi:hypothetical protein